MMYKITLSNGKDEIRVSTDEELAKIVEGITRGDKVIFCKEGVFNPSYMVSIMPDYERNNEEFRYLSSPEEKQRREEELRRESSPFAKALAGKFRMLSYKSETEAIEEAAREARMQDNYGN